MKCPQLGRPCLPKIYRVAAPRLTPLMKVPKANQKETSLHEMTLVIADSGYVVTAYLTEEVRHKMKTN